MLLVFFKNILGNMLGHLSVSQVRKPFCPKVATSACTSKAHKLTHYFLFV